MLSPKARALLDYEREHPDMGSAKLEWLTAHGWRISRHHQQIDRLLLDPDVMAEYPDVAARAAERRERTINAGQSNRPVASGL